MVTRFRLSGLTAVRLKERSVSPEAVLRRAGLPPGLLGDEGGLVTTEQLFAFWRAVGDVSGDPAIGLSFGSESRTERLDLVTLAALSASHFRDAMARAARYKQLCCPEEIQVNVRESECAIQFRWLLAEDVEPWVLTDLCFAWITMLATKGTDGAVRPHRVELKRAARNRRIYESHFACRVRFNAPDNALIFRASDLDRPFLTHNADLLGILAPQLDAELADRDARQDVREQVKRVLRRLLASGRPDLRNIARELGSSSRTLQRRLGDLGISYQQVLEEARREMANQYLAHSSFELPDIAYLLGYEDANSFFRAFHRWEGVPPGRWRDEQRIRSSRPSA
jgi:AraC-like DNA-binding protein